MLNQLQALTPDAGSLCLPKLRSEYNKHTSGSALAFFFFCFTLSCLRVLLEPVGASSNDVDARFYRRSVTCVLPHLMMMMQMLLLSRLPSLCLRLNLTVQTRQT